MSNPDPPPPSSSFHGGETGGYSAAPQFPFEEPNLSYPVPVVENPDPFNIILDNSSNKIQVQSENPTNRGNDIGTVHIFYKTRICQRFTEGKCWAGDRCTFAHGYEELRDPMPNWKDIVGSKDRDGANWNNDDQKIIHRMKICRMFYINGDCSYGDNCTFLHEEPSKFRSPEVIKIGTSTTTTTTVNNHDHDHNNNNNNNNNLQINSTFWKSKTCTKWETTGSCPFGERCQFGHGAVIGGRKEEEESVGVNPSKGIGVVKTTTHGFKNWKEKWMHKKSKKINGIYGDWLEGMSPPRE